MSTSLYGLWPFGFDVRFTVTRRPWWTKLTHSLGVSFVVGQYQPFTEPRFTSAPLPNVGRHVVVSRFVKNGLVSGMTRSVASCSASALAYRQPSPGQLRSSCWACSSVVGMAVLAGSV